METGSRNCIATNGRSILLDLHREQKQFPRESVDWLKIQKKIDKIVAQNYLRYQIGESQ